MQCFDKFSHVLAAHSPAESLINGHDAAIDDEDRKKSSKLNGDAGRGRDDKYYMSIEIVVHARSEDSLPAARISFVQIRFGVSCEESATMP